MNWLNITSCAVLLCAISLDSACDEKMVTEIHYYDQAQIEADDYLKERAVLDVYCPGRASVLKPTLVWFHGGGLTRGKKYIPSGLKDKGICVVAANYRFYPKVKTPVYIEDAAAAVAWVFKNIEGYGGNSELIFVSGHSAGGYLASMVGLDKKWLAIHGVDANQIAGLMPLSGHTITHFTVRRERGISNKTPIVDELAPLFHVRSDAPPLLLITGDREKELLGRYEENAYLMRMMKVAGHKQTTLHELEGYGHIMVEPAIPLVINEIQRIKSNKGL